MILTKSLILKKKLTGNKHKAHQFQLKEIYEYIFIIVEEEIVFQLFHVKLIRCPSWVILTKNSIHLSNNLNR